MKKDILKSVKGAVLTKQEAKTITGGYNIGGNPCTYSICAVVYYGISDSCNASYYNQNGFFVAIGQLSSGITGRCLGYL